MSWLGLPRACALLALVVLAAGCGGGQKSAAVPDGFETFDGQGYTFAHPAGWRRVAEGSSKGAQGPKGTGGLAPQAAVSSGPGPGPDLETAILWFKADQLFRRADWKVVREEKIEVAGADEAMLTEARYNGGTGNSITPVRTIDVHARTEDGRLYDLYVRSAEADFDRARLREVIDTFRVE